MVFLNGQIPLSALRKIDATHYASPGCAHAWFGFAGELGLTVGNATDAAYRSLAWQQYRWNLHRADPLHAPIAAYPGTSNHGWGQAIDIGNYYRYAHKTLVSVGRRYGFEFDTPSEAWHIRYTGAAYYTTPASTTVTPLEAVMALPDYEYVYTKDKGLEYALISPTNLPDGYLRSTVVNTASGWSAATGKSLRLIKTRASFEAAISSAKQLHDLYKTA